MFIDQEWKKNPDKENHELGFSEKSKEIKPLYLTIAVVFFIISSLFIFYYYINSEFYVDGSNVVHVPAKTEKSTTTPVLPKYFGENNSGLNEGYIPDDLKAENLNFGSFYEKALDRSVFTIKQYNLPINIKADVKNYYDLSRKIDIEDKVDELNENGFAMLQTQFDAEKSDFFKMYRTLIQNEIPIFVSSDFIRYYNQNVLKDVYKEIEKGVFYENLWDISKKLYDISLARYSNHLESSGLANDPLLEGERLETAFLAVTLELLKPKQNQISTNEAFSEENLFNEQESHIYYFNIPRDLQREVLKELELINKSSTVETSPIFLYEKDYKAFLIPSEYKLDSKLKNYYLAKKWMNSLFPLYFKNEDCEKCLLDYNDWLNNFAAANLLAKDFNDNQDLKNRWAAIYKFLAFFEGLRSDLTYLNLTKANNEVFEDKQAMDLLFKESEDQNSYIISVQKKLEEYSFLPIEGPVDRNDKAKKPLIGIRILQDNFWPNDYIFSELTSEKFIKNYSSSKEEIITSCKGLKASDFYKCLGFSGDILNILNIAPKTDYYLTNFDYVNYHESLDKIHGQINLFDKGTWNSNVFWLNLDLSNTLVKNTPTFVSKMSLSNKWIEEKTTNEVLGAWVNVATPRDDWENFQSVKNQSLGFVSECSLHNYIEPQVELFADMIERNKMLLKSIEVLRVGKKTNSATLILNELNNKLTKFKDIAQKEIKGETINEDECHELTEILSEINVLKTGDKKYFIENNSGKIQINIEGVKLMALIKTEGNEEKVLVVGPIFNFKEKK